MSVELTKVVTGEVVADNLLSEHDANHLDGRIRRMSAAAADHMEKILELVNEAKAGQIHVALGFPSWPAYLADAVQKPLLAFGERSAVVSLMSNQGMTNRAIAEIIGKDEKTVRNDLAQLRNDSAVDDQDAPEVGTPATPAAKTGRNGKTYLAKPPAPGPSQKPRRAPFGGDIATVTQDLNDLDLLVARAIRRLETLKDDDRYPQHRANVEARLRNWYERLGAEIDRLLPHDVIDADVVDEGDQS